MISMIFWSYWWDFGKQEGRQSAGSDMVRPLKDPLLQEPVVEGLSRIDLHRLAIRRAVQATWDLPNVTYNMMWEYNNVWPFYDEDWEFHRWWVDEVKEQGRAIDPDMTHLFSVEDASVHPSRRNADFLTEEDGNMGITAPGSLRSLLSYRVPLVAWSLDNLFGNGMWGGDTTALTPFEIRKAILQGVHPAQTFVDLAPTGKQYFLQARCYLENIRTWADEPGTLEGDEITESALPQYVDSERPTLANPPGYRNGYKVQDRFLEFACLYTDPDGDAPAQAEVWVDRNGDRRFDPAPSKGERIAMTTRETSYATGVLFKASEIAVSHLGHDEVRYVFRFADRHWYPPEVGGLVAGKNGGITYDHWRIPATATAVGAYGGPSLPRSLVLDQNFPNPFNSGTAIRFTLPTRGHVDLAVFDLAGRKVASLVKEPKEAGTYRIDWDGCDGQGRQLASGVYVYRLWSEGVQEETRKLLLLR